MCGQCHVVQSWVIGDKNHIAQIGSGPLYRPGDKLVEILEIWSDGSDVSHFWSDGMVRVTGREFNGLIESPCYQNGKMSCFSCHQMHQTDDDPRSRKDWADDQLKPRMRGNEACLQCHSVYRSEDRLIAHTHHSQTSQGSVCYNCHMPNTTYGILKATRSHVVSSPSVAETLSTGRPNACNLCHLDKSLKWTSGNLKEWFNHSPPSDESSDVALSLEMALSGDAGQRALIAWHMGWEPAREASSERWLPPFLSMLMDDDYDAIRFIAHRSLKQIGGYDDIQYDHVAPSSDRSGSCRRIVNRWERQVKSPRAYSPSVLLTAEGKLQRQKIEKLLQQRNQRAVDLDE